MRSSGGWKGVLVAGAVALAAGPAAGLEVRLAAYTGVGITADTDLTVRQPQRGTELVFRDVEFDDKSLSLVSAPYMGVRWEAWSERRPRFSFGVEFLHFKIFTETDRVYETVGTYRGLAVDGPVLMDAVVQQYDVANGVNLVMAQAAYRRPDLLDGRLEAYFGIGVGPTIPFTKATVDGDGGDGHYELGKVGGQVFAGAMWPFGDRWGVLVEGKWSWTTVDGSVPGGDSEADLSTRHLVAGVSYRF